MLLSKVGAGIETLNKSPVTFVLQLLANIARINPLTKTIHMIKRVFKQSGKQPQERDVNKTWTVFYAASPSKSSNNWLVRN